MVEHLNEGIGDYTERSIWQLDPRQILVSFFLACQLLGLADLNDFVVGGGVRPIVIEGQPGGADWQDHK